ncbi:MAG: TrkA family potassium uptake protein [Oscillospiraceae bacterium]
MNILVVGCGRVGCRLVQILEELGHAVSVIDEQAQNIEKLNEMSNLHIGGMTVIGVPIDVDVLRSAGIEGCDAVAAVTPDDNINIMVGQVAENIFHVPRIITRVTDPSRKEVFSQRFGMRAICSTNLTVYAMLAGLLSDDAPASHTITIGSSTANFMTFPIDKSYVGRTISSLKPPHEGLVLYGILRANNTMELAGTQDLLIRSDDEVIYSEIAD